MPISQPSFKPGQTTILGAATSLITNLPLILAETEYSHALQANLKQLLVKARGNATLKITFVATESGTKYFTISRGNTLTLDGLSFASETLYIRSTAAGEVAEILELY